MSWSGNGALLSLMFLLNPFCRILPADEHTVFGWVPQTASCLYGSTRFCPFRINQAASIFSQLLTFSYALRLSRASLKAWRVSGRCSVKLWRRPIPSHASQSLEPKAKNIGSVWRWALSYPCTTCKQFLSVMNMQAPDFFHNKDQCLWSWW